MRSRPTCSRPRPRSCRRCSSASATATRAARRSRRRWPWTSARSRCISGAGSPSENERTQMKPANSKRDQDRRSWWGEQGGWGSWACVAMLLASAGPARAGGALSERDGAPVHWRERRLDPAMLPDELPAAAKAAVAAWHPWASGHQYRLDLDGSGRLLLVVRASNDRAPQLLELAAAVLARFDQDLPAPAVRLEAKDPLLAVKPKEPEKPKPAGGDKPLPEDPEDPEGSHPWKLPPPKPAQVTSAQPVITKWGSQGAPLDSETMTLFIATDQADFESLLK